MLKDRKNDRARSAPVHAGGAGAESVFEGQSGASRYMQLASMLKHRITSGEWPIGHRLPTVQKISEDFGLAKITVRQAFAVLVHEKLITSQRGRGTYVCSAGAGLDPGLRSAINDVSVAASVLGIRILEKRSGVRLPANLNEEGRADADYTLLRKLHLHDGEPFCLAQFYIATDVFKRFPKGSEKKHKIVRLIRDFSPVQPTLLHQTVTVEPADYDLARTLGYSFSAPVARIRRISCDSDRRIITAGFSWYRGDRFILDMAIPTAMTTRYPEIAIPGSRTSSE
jgi:GntR family transcriptional regulator